MLAWVAALGLSIVLAGVVRRRVQGRLLRPGSDSSAAQTLLEDEFPAQSGDTVDVVVRTDGGRRPPQPSGPTYGPCWRTRRRPARRSASTTRTRRRAGSPPTAAPWSRTPGWTCVNPPDMPVADSQRMLDDGRRRIPARARASRSAARPSQQAEQGDIGSEGIGLAAAAIILLVTFGSVVAAGLPILVRRGRPRPSSAPSPAVLIAFVDAPDWSTSLATMMGIGVGIDYALLIVTRYREWLAAGLDRASRDRRPRWTPPAGPCCSPAAPWSSRCSACSRMGLVVHARRRARSAILGVLVVMLAARHAASRRCSATSAGTSTGCGCRSADAPVEAATAGTSRRRAAGSRWSRLRRAAPRSSRPSSASSSLLALAAPFLGVRFGFPDAGNDPSGTTTRQAYDLMADGLRRRAPTGRCSWSPSCRHPAARPRSTQADRRAASDRASPRSRRPAVNPDGDTAVFTVDPDDRPAGPGDRGPGPPRCATTSCRRDRRHRRSTSRRRHHRGARSTHRRHRQAAAAVHRRRGRCCRSCCCSSSFRSVRRAVKAAVMNLLSVGRRVRRGRAGLPGRLGRPADRHRHRDADAGVHAGDDVRDPVRPLDGLRGVPASAGSARTWLRTGDNARAVAGAWPRTGRVITAAAAIMVAVFVAFMLEPGRLPQDDRHRHGRRRSSSTPPSSGWCSSRR